MIENSILRKNARAQLGGDLFKRGWLMMLLVCLIYSVMMTVAGYTVIGAVIIAGPLTYGLSRAMLKVVRGVVPITKVEDLFSGFTEGFLDTFLLGLLTGIFTFLWSLLFIIPGIIKAYSYALAPFIQQDSANKDWKYCLDKSKQMMDGHKGQLFVLDLSFIGWYLLGALCLGIGTLFVIPYHNMAKANFYEALRATTDNQ